MEWRHQLAVVHIVEDTDEVVPVERECLRVVRDALFVFWLVDLDFLDNPQPAISHVDVLSHHQFLPLGKVLLHHIFVGKLSSPVESILQILLAGGHATVECLEFCIDFASCDMDTL